MTTDFKVGDEVVARSKTDPLTVVHGKVVWALDGHIEIEPTGHEGDELPLDTGFWDIERVTPEIEFGPGACVQLCTQIATRAQDGSWFWMTAVRGLLTDYKDAHWRESVLNGTAKVHFYGAGVTPHESWPKVVTP